MTPESEHGEPHEHLPEARRARELISRVCAQTHRHVEHALVRMRAEELRHEALIDPQQSDCEAAEEIGRHRSVAEKARGSVRWWRHAVFPPAEQAIAIARDAVVQPVTYP